MEDVYINVNHANVFICMTLRLTNTRKMFASEPSNSAKPVTTQKGLRQCYPSFAPQYEDGGESTRMLLERNSATYYLQWYP